jgi:flagellar hook-associated protein 2
MSTSSTSSTTTSSSPISAGPLDVQSLVASLMSVNDQPMTVLQGKATGVQTQISAYGSIKSALSSLETAAEKLQNPGSFQAATASVSGSSVTANVTGTPAPGTYSVAVSQLAQAEAVASSAFSSSSATVGTGTLTIQLGSYNSTSNAFTSQSGSTAVSIPIDSSDNTLDGIASAINGANAGVSATVVTDSNGARLLLSSTNSGAANSFSVSVSGDNGSGLAALAYDPTAAAGSGGMTQTQAAQDAKYTVNGLPLSSASNAVTGVVNGLTLNLTQAPAAGSAAGTTAQSTVTVATDGTTIQSTVSSFVDAYNSLQSLVTADTAYDPTTQQASVLTGDSSLNLINSQLTQVLSSTMSGIASGGLNNLAQVGVEFQQDGTIKLDTTTFSNALAANPTGVENLFANGSGTGSQQGIATQLSTTLASLLEPQGAVASRTSALQSQLTGIQTQETTLQAQLTAEQASLTQEYSTLNGSLAAMAQQQTQLTSLLDSLPG